MSKQREAEELYMLVQKAYKPIYFPNEDEKSEAIFGLSTYLFGKTIDKDLIIKKASNLAVIHGDHKSKVSTLINNRFWEQDIDFGVKANRFIDED